MQQSKDMSDFVLGFLNRLGDEAQKFYDHMNSMHGAQGKHITDFHKAFEVLSILSSKRMMFFFFVFASSCLGFLLISASDKQEQSRSETEKLLAEVTSLVSGHMSRQMELVSMIYDVIY